jgi:ABC-type polysaccharide/polyol phosphate export permease
MGTNVGQELLTTVYDSRANESFPRFLVKNISDLYRFRHAIVNFVVNNLRMRYRRSVLGFVWSLLNPLMVMLVIAVVFSIIFRQDIKSFAVYIFSGLVPWNYIYASILTGCQTIINAEGFLKKVYLPKTLFPVVSVSTETANFLFSIVSLYILAIILGFQVHWTILLLPLALVVTFFFNLGWAFLFGVVTVYFRDLTQIVIVLFQAIFYLAPIVYPL